MKAAGTGQTFLQVSLSLAFLLLAGISAYGQQKRVIAGPKGFPYSGGIVVGSTLYIAGQEAEDENGNLKARGIEPETRGALENLAKVVKAAGFELKDVVSVTVYLADLKEFEAMNKVYREFMPDPKPTRATVQVVRLVNDARIEISAIAVKEP
jgi:2-iminobutanoate/2-iminopropanoate deaminase